MKAPEFLKTTGSCLGTFLVVSVGWLVVISVVMFATSHLALVVVIAAVGGATYWVVKRYRPRYFLVLATQRYLPSPGAFDEGNVRIRFKVHIIIIREKWDNDAKQAVEQLLVRASDFSVESDQELAGIRRGWPVTCRDHPGGDRSQLTLYGNRSSHLTLGIAINAANKLKDSINSLTMVLAPTVTVSVDVHKDWTTSSGEELRDGRLVARETITP